MSHFTHLHTYLILHVRGCDQASRFWVMQSWQQSNLSKERLKGWQFQQMSNP